MRKKCLAAFLVICVICSTFVLAEESGLFDITTYDDYEIEYNGKEMSLNSPVLLINGQTYVPLRDFAKEAYIDVAWDGDAKKITLTDSVLTDYWLEPPEDIFDELFDFLLPESAEVLNYHYIDSMYPGFKAKVFFEESDLEYIKNNMDAFSIEHNSEEIAGGSCDHTFDVVYKNYSREYSWWDVSKSDALYVYEGVMEKGFEHSHTDGAIVKAADKDGYYLYISYVL